jgi:hypothetical protein
MKTIVALFALAIGSVNLPAQAFESHGLGDPVCFQFHLYGLNLGPAKALSATSSEYHFTARGQAAASSCEFAHGPYAVTIWGRWDAATGMASEQISHGDKSSPKYLVTHTKAKCPSDPWMNHVSCTLISQTNTRGDLESYKFEGRFPVSAAILSTAQRTALNKIVTPYQDFSVPPNTPPVIASPMGDAIYRNGAPVVVQIRRPADGNDRWHKENPSLQFEVQFQVNQEARIDTGRLERSFAPTWTTVPATSLIGTSLMSTSPISVPLTTFAAKGPGKGGDWQNWRVRARLAGSMTNRPWTNWVPFFVVVPPTVTKTPYAAALPELGKPAKMVPPPAPTPTSPRAITPATPATPPATPTAPTPPAQMPDARPSPSTAQRPTPSIPNVAPTR